MKTFTVQATVVRLTHPLFETSKKKNGGRGGFYTIGAYDTTELLL